MVLGGADHHEQLGPLEVGAAELPERAADRVDHAGGHVDRAEATVGGVVRRAELPGEEARQRLHLVAAGEQRERLGSVARIVRRRFFEQRERLLPRDLDEVPGAAFGAGLAHQRLGEPRRRVLLHDPRRTLGADHAVVQRVVGIAVDVPDLAVAQVHADAAAARAHVARVSCASRWWRRERAQRADRGRRRGASGWSCGAGGSAVSPPVRARGRSRSRRESGISFITRSRGHLSITAMGRQEYPGWVMDATASRRSGRSSVRGRRLHRRWRRPHN